MKELINNNLNIEERFKNVRSLTEYLVKDLIIDDMNIQTESFVSPTKWHLAHTTWFLENFILEKFIKKFKPYNKTFNYLFNSYYNSLGDQFPRDRRGFLSRPSVEEVLDYRSNVEGKIFDILNSKSCRNKKKLLKLVDVGINHEQQHQELILMDILNVYFQNPLKPKYSNNSSLNIVGNQKILWFDHQESEEIRFGSENDDFCFDNELPINSKTLPPFSIRKNLINNYEWKSFMDDKGYERADLWLSDGYDFIKKNSITKPLYWIDKNHMFTLNGLKKINDLDPVCHISFYEADAFARWSKKRLPTEFELESLLKKKKIKGNFLEDKKFEPTYNENKTELVNQIYGDVWEWTSSNYSPYAGFEKWKGSIGEYNGKFMCNQFVLKGGSCVTPISHIRASYRNFYYPSDRWQFSGLRLVK